MSSEVINSKLLSEMKQTMKIIIVLSMTFLLAGNQIFAKNNVNKEKTVIQSKKEKKVTVNTKKQKNKTQIAPSKKGEKDKVPAATSKDKKEKKTAETKDDKEKKKKDDNEVKKAEWIEKTIEYDVHKERMRAINYILTIKNEALKKKLEKKLISLIKDEINLEVRIKAITVAGELELKEAVGVLKDCLNHSSEDIKISAVYAIKKIGDDSTKSYLIEKLKEQKLEKNSTYTEALIDTLGDFKAAELQKYAVDSINDVKTTRNIRELFVLFLGKLESKKSKDQLVKILKDEEENKNIRALAANSLAKLGIKETAKDIDEVVSQIETYKFKKKKKYYKLYLYCIAALAKLGDEKAIPRLINSLRSDNASVRIRAIQLIKELKDKRTIDILKHKMKYDISPKVRREAEKALKYLGEDVEKIKQEGKSTGNKKSKDKTSKAKGKSSDKKAVNSSDKKAVSNMEKELKKLK